MFKKAGIRDGEDWRKHIGDGVMCWVWLTGKESERIPLVVTEYREGLREPYVTGVPLLAYPNAEPMAAEDVLSFTDKYLYKKGATMINVENTRPLDRRLQTKRRAQPGDLLIDSLCALCVLIPALVVYGALGTGIFYLVKEVMA